MKKTGRRESEIEKLWRENVALKARVKSLLEGRKKWKLASFNSHYAADPGSVFDEIKRVDR